MMRPCWVWVVVGLLAVTAGCRMCASCNDYSGPVLDGCCPGGCGDGPRAGSILSGMPAMPAVPAMESMVQATPDHTPPPNGNSILEPQPQVSYVPPSPKGGSARLHPEFGVDPRMILSITDRKVGEELDETPQESPQLVDKPARESSGWSSPQPAGQSH